MVIMNTLSLLIRGGWINSMLDYNFCETYVPLKEVSLCIFWTYASFNMWDLSSQKELDVGSDKEVAQSNSKMVCGGEACYFSDLNYILGFTDDISGFLDTFCYRYLKFVD